MNASLYDLHEVYASRGACESCCENVDMVDTISRGNGVTDGVLSYIQHNFSSILDKINIVFISGVAPRNLYDSSTGYGYQPGVYVICGKNENPSELRRLYTEEKGNNFIELKLNPRVYECFVEQPNYMLFNEFFKIYKKR